MKLVSVFFLVLFATFMVTPTMVIMIDNDSDISFSVPLSEEEQNGEERVFSEKHTKLVNKQQYLTFLSFITFTNPSVFLYNKNWTSIYFDTISPPPEYA